jgi:hypothetical protein
MLVFVFYHLKDVAFVSQTATLHSVFHSVLFSESPESESSGVVFIHQSLWQQQMLVKYGSNICLLDATYNTSVYDLPLLIVCVATNVGYVNVASIIVCDEKSESIAAGLMKLREWNPQWKPKYWMSDFHEGQISALEEVFCGNEHCELHFCNLQIDDCPCKGEPLRY